MDDVAKKRVMIGIMAACIATAAVIFYMEFFSSGGGSSASKGPVYLVCENPKCGKITKMSTAEFSKYMAASAPTGPMDPMGGGSLLKCPVCGEKSCYMGMKCKKCGKVFAIDPRRGKNMYVCPYCGYDEYGSGNSKKK